MLKRVLECLSAKTSGLHCNLLVSVIYSTTLLKYFFFFQQNFVGPSVCHCVAEYVGTRCGLEGGKKHWFSLSFFMTLHITTCLHFTDIEAHSVVWVLCNKTEHQEHKEKNLFQT